MRLLYCVQRYGEEIAGGAEAACRQFAERMSARGHEVQVLTTCALDYNSWADHYEPGTTAIAGVTVHRVPVREPRDPLRFMPLHLRTTVGPEPCLAVQRDWTRSIGPEAPMLLDRLAEMAQWADVVVFYTYLYATFGLGARRASQEAAVLLHPAAHDEPAWWLQVQRSALDACHGFSLHTPEERDLLRAKGCATSADELIGLGLDLGIRGDGARFRSRYGLGDEDLVVYVGRLDPGKGPDEVFRFMTHLHDSGRTRARLVVVGEPVIELPRHPGVTTTGFVDEQTKADALAAATVFVQPSYFESFSLSLCEAWVQGRAAMVQRRCKVLEGQVARSGGGLAYSGLAEFDASLSLLLADQGLRDRLGRAGRSYVEQHFRWDAVLDRYEVLLERTLDRAGNTWRGPERS